MKFLIRGGEIPIREGIIFFWEISLVLRYDHAERRTLVQLEKKIYPRDRVKFPLFVNGDKI